jgi:DNA-binding NarL/FixJ family response regulator
MGGSGDLPRAVVCDDAPGFRALMSVMLAEAGLDVVGEGETWADAERLAPGADVLVVDLWMPEIDIAALARVRAAAPTATLAVITALPIDDAARRIGDVAVDLLLGKAAPPTEVAAAIAEHVRATQAS